jgi:hypothetical protein
MFHGVVGSCGVADSAIMRVTLGSNLSADKRIFRHIRCATLGVFFIAREMLR